MFVNAEHARLTSRMWNARDSLMNSKKELRECIRAGDEGGIAVRSQYCKHWVDEISRIKRELFKLRLKTGANVDVAP